MIVEEVTPTNFDDATYTVAVMELGKSSFLDEIDTYLLEGRSSKNLDAVLDRVNGLFKELMAMVLELSEAGIFHGDFKPANLVRSDDGTLILVDFDLTTAIGDPIDSYTIGFGAPEIASARRSGSTSDLFSALMTLYYAALGENPMAKLLKDTGESKQLRYSEEALAQFERHLDAHLRAAKRRLTRNGITKAQSRRVSKLFSIFRKGLVIDPFQRAINFKAIAKAKTYDAALAKLRVNGVIPQPNLRHQLCKDALGK